MNLYDIAGNLILNEPEIKSYYEAEMADTIAKVRALQTEPNLTFFYVTDIHAYAVTGLETLYKTSIDNMRFLLKEIPCDGVVNLGDSVQGNVSSDITQNYGNQLSNDFREIGLPYYSVIGNHDDNRYANSGQRFSVPLRYQVYVSPTRKVVADATGLNYYVDFDEYGIRMICLNSVSDYTYKFTTDTCTWFTNVALDTTNKVLVNSHVPPVSSWTYNSSTPQNSSTIISALDTFSANGEVLGLIFGHNHLDGTFSSPYNGITLGCEKFESPSSTTPDPSWPSGTVKPQREAGTSTEDLWTVVIIRPNSRKINCVRFGAGLDYEVSY